MSAIVIVLPVLRIERCFGRRNRRECQQCGRRQTEQPGQLTSRRSQIPLVRTHPVLRIEGGNARGLHLIGRDVASHRCA